MPNSTMSPRMIRQFAPVWEQYYFPEYNCSEIRPPGQEWSRLTGSPQYGLGIWSVCFGTVSEIIYIPCIYAILKEIKSPCYKIMLFLAVVDMCALYVNALSLGYLVLNGAVFCTYPLYNFINGSVALGLWCAECGGCLILVTNRLLELMDLSYYTRGKKTIFLIACATVYAFYMTLFTPPPFINSLHGGALFFDPFIGRSEAVLFYSWPHFFNNVCVVLMIAFLYAVLCGILLTNTGLLSTAQGRQQFLAGASIYVQAALICFFSLVASLIYVYMNFFPISTGIIQMAQAFWQLSHGIPPFIYITLNKTIRNHIRVLFGCQKKIEFGQCPGERYIRINIKESEKNGCASAARAQ